MAPRIRSVEPWLYRTLLAAHLVPVWAFAHLATQDGPSHLANAVILLRLWSGECPITGAFFTHNTGLFPNWLSPLLLAGLSAVFPPALAEKLLQSATIVLTAAAWRRLVRVLRPENAWLSLAIFPFLYAYPFLMGFYGFSLGVGVLLLLLGTWAQQRSRMTARGPLLLGLLGLALFFLHPLPFAAGCALVALLTGSAALADVRARQIRALLPLASLAPGALLFAVYLAAPTRAAQTLRSPPAANLGYLLSGQSLVAYAPAEVVFSTAAALLLLAAGAIALGWRRRFPSHPLERGWLAGLVLMLAAYFAVPDFSARGGYVSDRLQLLFLLTLLAWLATLAQPRRVCAALGLALGAAAVGLLVVKTRALVELDAALALYLSAGERIEAGHTLVPLNFTPGNRLRGGGPSLRVDPLLHASGYLVAEKCLVSLDNYEAGYTDHFPTRFRPGRNPYAVARYDEGRPERFDFARWAQRSGSPVDYVLVWGSERALAQAEPSIGTAIRGQLRTLEQDYVLLEHSGPLALYGPPAARER